VKKIQQAPPAALRAIPALVLHMEQMDFHVGKTWLKGEGSSRVGPQVSSA
jgi:hypothetical protein